MWRGPQEYITFELYPTSLAVSSMSGSSNFDSFCDGWSTSCCFVGCCLQDLFNIARNYCYLALIILVNINHSFSHKEVINSTTNSNSTFKMVWETRVQSPVESYQRLKKWHLVRLCLTLTIIKYGSRVKWNNPVNGVPTSTTPRCGSYWKESLRVTLD